MIIFYITYIDNSSDLLKTFLTAVRVRFLDPVSIKSLSGVVRILQARTSASTVTARWSSRIAQRLLLATELPHYSWNVSR